MDYGRYVREMREASGDIEKRAVLRRLVREPDIDRALENDVRSLLSGDSYSITIPQAEGMLEVRAFVESTSKVPEKGAAAKRAAEIKQKPLYRDAGIRDRSNWMSRSFERAGESVGNIVEGLLSRNAPRLEGIPAGSGWLNALVPIFWVLLSAAVLAFAVFAARHFAWKSGLERKAKALLDDDEPELTRDEYLEEADRLANEGKFREAVRYLYLACLLLFDENRVARFLRSETNWEHLGRIRKSAALPADLDFEPATRKFDVVWYGMRLDGRRDVDAMRDWYLQVAERLRRKAEK